MTSAVIKFTKDERKDQLTLDFTPGLIERHRSLRDCIAAGVYRNGLGKVAIDLNQAPGNLSVQISEDPSRNFSVDSLELYLTKYPDREPIMYLIEKFLAPEARPANAQQINAIKSQMLELMGKLESLGAA